MHPEVENVLENFYYDCLKNFEHKIPVYSIDPTWKGKKSSKKKKMLWQHIIYVVVILQQSQQIQNCKSCILIEEFKKEQQLKKSL